jgi:hypothetical protein
LLEQQTELNPTEIMTDTGVRGLRPPIIRLGCSLLIIKRNQPKFSSLSFFSPTASNSHQEYQAPPAKGPLNNLKGGNLGIGGGV